MQQGGETPGVGCGGGSCGRAGRAHQRGLPARRQGTRAGSPQVVQHLWHQVGAFCQKKVISYGHVCMYV